MNAFRSYNQRVEKYEEGRDAYLSMEKQLNTITLAMLTIICSNYFMSQMVANGVQELRGFPDFYNKKLKVACEALYDKTRTLDRKLSKDIDNVSGPKYLYCLADMCDDLDEHMIPVYEGMKNEMEKVFRDENKLENSHELAIIFAMDCAIFIANDISNQIRNKYPDIRYALGKLLDINDIYRKSELVTHVASMKTPENTRINLNAHLNIMAKKRRLSDIVLDPDTFSNAFKKAGFKIDKPEDNGEEKQQ